MKKIILFLLTAVSYISLSHAVPAHPGSVKVKQPDGTYVTVRLHGDEYLNFNTTEDGFTVIKCSDGFYRYATGVSHGQLSASEIVAHDAANRSADETAFLASQQRYLIPAMTESGSKMHKSARQRAESPHKLIDYNKFKGLVILAEYSDRKFMRDDVLDFYKDMTSKEDWTGYTDHNSRRWVSCTGSVSDYFRDNSFGIFKPTFDILGPIELDYKCTDMKQASMSVEIMLDVLSKAEAQTDLSQYDIDNDGYLDMVYIIYAGYGSNISGNDENYLWPHANNYTGYSRYMKWSFDGKYIGRFACSTEISDSEVRGGTSLDGIGTICHEFSHVLGLMDHYDANYEEDGRSADPGSWDVMAGGNYLNDSRTPAGYNAYERAFLGFAEAPTKIDGEGSFSLEQIGKNGKSYRIDSPNKDEYFLLENRQKSFKWDAYLPGVGMLVFRVDESDPDVWQSNSVNTNPAHNYFKLVRANGDHVQGGYSIDGAGDAFPGTANVKELNNVTEPANLLTWNGKSTQWGLDKITLVNGNISFYVSNTYILKMLSLPDAADVAVGQTIQLDAVPTPSYATYKLEWSSSNTDVATVDNEGKLTGVAEGTAVITVTSDNGLSASCTVTVNTIAAISVAEFKTKDVGTEALLQLRDARVLYVYNNDSYIRDGSGSTIMFKDIDLGLKRNDIVSGTLFAGVASENGLVQAVSLGMSSDASGLTITAGETVQPRAVNIDRLADSDYCDLVKLKAVKLVKNGGVWAEGNDKSLRVWQKFQVKNVSIPKNYNGKYYNVIGIYGTDVLNGEIIDELYLVDFDGQFEAASPSIEGDVTGDGVVNGTDLTALANVILGNREMTDAADVNGDGTVNGTDLTALVNIIMSAGE